jgi:hypothetical protein
MPNKLKDPWQYNDQWNYYKAPGGPETPPPPVAPQPTRYSDKAFLHTPQAAVGVPLLLAFVTSCAIMAGTATFVWLIGGYEYTRPVVASGVATFIISWLAFQFRWISLTKLEEITGLELDGKPGIGRQPQTGSVRVQVEEIKEDGHIGISKQFDLPATPAQLKALAIGLHDEGRSLAERDWSPLEAGKPFTIEGIRQLKKEMLGRGIIVYVNSKNAGSGFTETKVGSRIIESWKEFDDDVSMWA